MATYTSNLNLYMPDSTDDFGEFRAEHNDNMVKIDNAIGGGGGSGGHTIIDPNGNSLPQESGLQFTGGVTVTDDSVNGKTVVDILGGGGNVYGAFIDTNRVITSGTYNTSLTYTATEDCFVVAEWVSPQNDSAYFSIDGERAFTNYASSSVDAGTITLPLKRGQVLTGTTAYNSTKSYKVYGVVQGTNGIFTPIIYSDNERVVGVWRDNKPLYQKTTHIGAISANASSAFSVGIGANVVDTMVSYNVIAYVSSGAWVNLPQPLPSNISSYASYVDNYNKANDTINIITGADRDFSDAFVTVQYTKTTDSAGSGNWNTDGVPTVHYSTSEQVIGTWIDGKPLYKKTVHVANSQGSFSDYVTIETMTDLKMSVSADFTARRYIAGAGEWFISGNGTARAEQNDTYYIGVRVFNQNLQYVIGGYGTQITDLWITVRYTKTTD